MRMIRPAAFWLEWIDRALLFLGASLALAGIIFLIAYNWPNLHRWVKFGIFEAAIIAATAWAVRKGLEGATGKALLVTVWVLTGAILAVYGQTYQTGADAFELFLGWTVLSLPSVLAARFAPLWLLWLLVFEVGIVLFWEQYVIYDRYWRPYEARRGLFWILTAQNLAALWLYEAGRARKLDWLKSRAPRAILIVAAISPLAIMAMKYVFEFNAGDLPTFLAVLVFAALVVGGQILYSLKVPDFTSPALLTLAAWVFMLALTVGFFDRSSHSEEFAAFMIAVTVLGLTTACIFWLNFVRKTMRENARED